MRREVLAVAVSTGLFLGACSADAPSTSKNGKFETSPIPETIYKGLKAKEDEFESAIRAGDVNTSARIGSCAVMSTSTKNLFSVTANPGTITFNGRSDQGTIAEYASHDRFTGKVTYSHPVYKENAGNKDIDLGKGREVETLSIPTTHIDEIHGVVDKNGEIVADNMLIGEVVGYVKESSLDRATDSNGARELCSHGLDSNTSPQTLPV